MTRRNTAQRRHAILAQLQEQGEVSVDELARQLETSEVTIRKDLAALERNGLLLRRYGGAVAMPQELLAEAPPQVSPFKQAIARESATCVCPPDQPVCTCSQQPRLRRIGKPIRPGAIEIEHNPRSRSAIMRVAERLPAAEAANEVRHGS